MFDKTQAATALIANADSVWTEADRPTLEALSDEKLELLLVDAEEKTDLQAVVNEAKQAIGAPETINTDLPAVLRAKIAANQGTQMTAPKNMQEWLAIAPPEAKPVWDAAQQVYNTAKANIVTQLTANSGLTGPALEQFKEFLGNKSVEDLQKLVPAGQQPTANGQTLPSISLTGARPIFNAAGSAPAITGNGGKEDKEPMPRLTANFAANGKK